MVCWYLMGWMEAEVGDHIDELFEVIGSHLFKAGHSSDNYDAFKDCERFNPT